MTNVLQLNHSDEASGTTITDDGTKIHWTEGYSDTVIVRPDGRVERVGWEDIEAHPLADVLVDPAASESRAMTEAEEAEHARARG